jgi:hypothetical protein
MIDQQQSKKSGHPIDLNYLSPDDRRAFERVARILNRPLSQLYEDDPQHTIVGRNGIAEAPFPGGDATYIGPQTWLSTTEGQDMHGWQQYFGGNGMDKHNHHPNEAPAPSSGLMFEGEAEYSFLQWTEPSSQGPSSQIGGRGNTPTSDNQTWFSVPTDFLTRLDHQDETIGDNATRTSSGRSVMERAAVPSRDDRLTSNAGSLRQDQNATNGVSSPSHALLDSDIVELGWVDLKAAHQSTFGVQPTTLEERAKSEWSLIESSKNQDSYLLDNSNAKSVKWVPSDSTGKELSPRKKRGPFQDQQLREETSGTRKLKACVRCRMQKIRVSVLVFDPLSISSYQFSATPTLTIQAVFARHIRMFRSRKSIHFRACGTSLQNAHSIALGKLQDWNLRSDGLR